MLVFVLNPMLVVIANYVVLLLTLFPIVTFVRGHQHVLIMESAPLLEGVFVTQDLLEPPATNVPLIITGTLTVVFVLVILPALAMEVVQE